MKIDNEKRQLIFNESDFCECDVLPPWVVILLLLSIMLNFGLAAALAFVLYLIG